MLCINNTYTDVYFNLAAEEYLLKSFPEDIFMLWQNESAVVVGKHQNVLAEVNLEYAEKNHIKIARRSSGGGTVFHDLGNLNLTFIESNDNVNFDRFTERVIATLSQIGIHGESDARRAINIGGLKVSGSAQYIYKDRAMYHATLLFTCDLDSLVSTLESNPEQQFDIEDKRIYTKSVKSPVTNIYQHLEKPFDISVFKKYILDYFLNEKSGNKTYRFSREDISSIHSLIENKYGTYDWNYHGKKPVAQKINK